VAEGFDLAGKQLSKPRSLPMAVSIDVSVVSASAPIGRRFLA
jgi:hypothetical protein